MSKTSSITKRIEFHYDPPVDIATFNFPRGISMRNGDSMAVTPAYRIEADELVVEIKQVSFELHNIERLKGYG